jgi:hypothetical protein
MLLLIREKLLVKVLFICSRSLTIESNMTTDRVLIQRKKKPKLWFCFFLKKNQIVLLLMLRWIIFLKLKQRKQINKCAT